MQDALERALATFSGEPVRVVCAGRTDAGVHATGQVVHFDTHLQRAMFAWVRGTNAFLPPAVAVRWAHAVDASFHARFSAHGRRYRYLLINRPHRTGLWHQRAAWHHQPLALHAMQAAAQTLLGEHDFSAFRAAECQADSPVKIMRRAEVHQLGDLLLFDFEASAFLQHMVRNLVGSLVCIGQRKRPPEWLSELLLAGDRRLAAPTFPAAGLYLVAVRYARSWGLPADAEDAPLSFLSALQFAGCETVHENKDQNLWPDA